MSTPTVPEIKVSLIDLPATDTRWSSYGATVDLHSEEKYTLYFRVVPNGTPGLAITFPVSNGPASETDITDVKNCNDGTFDMQVWPLNTTVKCKRADTVNNVFEIDYQEEQNDTIVLKLDVETVKAVNGIARCKVDYYDNNILETLAGGIIVNITKEYKKPRIKKFIVTKGIVTGDERFNIEWDVDDAEVVKLSTTGSLEPLTVRHAFVRENEEIKFETTYTLTATNPKFTTIATRTVKYHDNTTTGKVKTFEESEGKSGSLLNLFTAGSKMFALVKTVDGSDVLMWETADGINWSKCKNGAFGKDIPLAFAGCSSVVHGNKLYLIGGSRFDADFKSNKVYSFSLTDDAARWKKEDNGTFSPRMGQAVVLYKTGNKDDPKNHGDVWLIGGYGDQGTLNDVYTFNGTKWDLVPTESCPKLCMHNAVVVGDSIQLYGGFGRVPGELDQRIIDSVSLNLLTAKKQWEKVNWFEDAKGTEPFIKEHLQSNIFASTPEGNFLFTMYMKSSVLYPSIFEIDQNKRLIARSDSKFALTDYFAGVQAVTFKNVVWFCSVKDDGEFESNKLTYFIHIKAKSI